MKKMAAIFACFLLVCFALGASALVLAENPTNILGKERVDELTGAYEQHAREAYGKLPLTFVTNAGQTNPRVKYYTEGPNYGLYFTSEEAVFAFVNSNPHNDKAVALALQPLEANPKVRLEAQQEGTGKVNYLIGNDPSKWQTNLSTYREVVYQELWPGVDMVFRGANGKLEYDFVLQPGARVEDIKLTYLGSDDMSLDETGNLLISTPLGVLTDQRPWSYQEIWGWRTTVESHFVLNRHSDGEIVYGFEVGDSYDPRYPLVIDPGLVYYPGLVYSTYLGGSDGDLGRGIAVDDAGNAYVVGITSSTDFPTVLGAFPSYNGGGDAFVAKLNADGTGLVYSTYLGGSSGDQGSSIAVDSDGNAYVTGWTLSRDFPTTSGAFQTRRLREYDAFVTKLNAAGNSLEYSTYLGGRNVDYGMSIAVDSDGEDYYAYVTGYTYSKSFPTTSGAYDEEFDGSRDAFVTKLNAGGTDLVYSTFLGGSSIDHGYSIAVDDAGNAYITGLTMSSSGSGKGKGKKPKPAKPFPTTPGAYCNTLSGGNDAFVTKLNPAGSGLEYSTYLGGSGSDGGNSIAVYFEGEDYYAYVTGSTMSDDFPIEPKPGAYCGDLSGTQDAFVSKLNPAGQGEDDLLYSTYLGGPDIEYSWMESGKSIAVDGTGNAYVTGYTESDDFPTTSGPIGPSGGQDAFVTKLNLDPDGLGPEDLVYSTYLGGSSHDIGISIAVDSDGYAYVTGMTQQANDFPTTDGAFDRDLDGIVDAFVTKLDPSAGDASQSAGVGIAPKTFALFQNSPNPFRGETAICFSVPVKSHVTLTVHDVTGRTVASLADGEFRAGIHTIEWNADVPSGVYFYRIHAGDFTAGMKMLVLR